LSIFLILLIWDWSFFRSHNFSFGIQGRYYFPTIISHMSLLTLGIYQLGKLFKKLQKPLLFLLSTLFIVINFIAFYHLISSYYDTSNLTAFINQASQYKPWFAKGYWLISALILNIGVSILYIYQLFIYVKNKK
ncbi:hypothetical protein KKB06_03450, partial [Patescibacteria group bacterium]|nr:hypothetical protein [Patescibacteria group bacterium]